MRSQDLVRLNKAAILEALQTKGPLGTFQLEQETNLSTRTIQAHIRTLRGEGLVGKVGHKWTAIATGDKKT